MKLNLQRFIQFKTISGRRRHTNSAAAEVLEIRSLLSGVAGTPDVTFGGGDAIQSVIPPEEEISSGRVGIDVNSAGQIFGFAEYNDEVIFARTASGAPLKSFNGDGFLRPLDLGFHYNIGAIAVQSDGKIVVGGASGGRFRSPTSPGDFGFMRLNPNGTRDLSFGTNGIAVISGSVNDYGLNSIVIKPDGTGSIIAVGTSKVAGGNDGDGIDLIALMQLTSNGHPDPAFGDTGTPGISLAGYETIAEKVMFDTVTNRIVVVGEQSLAGWELPGEDFQKDISIHQFLPDGREDMTFGGGNGETTIGDFGWYESAESATLSGDWIYVAGFGYSNSDSRDFVARVSRGTGSLTYGTWDQSFGGDGFREVSESILGITDGPNGGFYLAGGIYTSAGSMSLSKFKPDGSRDVGFGVSGVSRIPTVSLGGSESELIRDKQGHLLFAGANIETGGFDYALQVVRFNEHETVDKPTLTAPVAWSNDLTPTIAWNPDTFAARYILQVNNLSTGQTRVVYRQNIESTSFTPTTDLAPGKYRAWVRGVSANNVLSPWSGPRDFEVQPLAPAVSSPTGPVADSTPRIDWNDVAGATTYDVSIAFADAPTVVILSQTGLTTSEFTPTAPLHIWNYVVSVRASNTTGLLTAWSTPSAFTVTLESPAGLRRSRVVNTTNSRLSWNPVLDAVEYDLWVDRTDVPQLQIIRERQLTTNQLTAPLVNGTYNFRVRAAAANGEFSDWSAPVTFVVAIGTPVITGPASTSDQTPTIRWSDDNASRSYEIRITAAATGSVIIPPTSVTPRSFTPAIALPYGKYYVWVRGVNASGLKTAWSIRHEMNILLPAPGITSPGANSSSTPLITWSSVAGASLYDLQVDNMTTGQTQVIRRRTLSTTQFQVISPLTAGTYRIWVRAISSNSVAGFWSAFVDVAVS